MLCWKNNAVVALYPGHKHRYFISKNQLGTLYPSLSQACAQQCISLARLIVLTGVYMIGLDYHITDEHELSLTASYSISSEPIIAGTCKALCCVSTHGISITVVSSICALVN